MENQFNELQNMTSQWGDNLLNMRPEALDGPVDSECSSLGGLELSQAPDILRKSIERFLIGNVI